MYIIIIGCGETGSALAKHLAGEDHEIVVVEEDEERAKALAGSMDALVIHGDGSNTEILKDAGIEKADAVVILTRDDNTNLTICQIVKKFNVKRIVSRVNDPTKQDLYISLEITAAISPIAAIVSYFKNAITQGRGRSIISIEKGKAEILEIRLTNEALDGRKIKDAGLPSEAVIGLISRGGEIVIASPEAILRKGDLLIVVSKTEASKDVITLLKG
ncbi:MAG: NAD-binding protein [Candidatus Altiarchaeota archaeon]|nr:NAD-binding protein [Candidatus Altiarchaeota archaeon]